MNYTGGEALVEALKQHGVKTIFSSPGTEWAPVWEALAKQHGRGEREPAYFNCRHEMLAVSAAMGYAQKKEEMPAVLLHTSAGLLHGAMAIRRAYADQVPMLICAGEAVRFTESRDPEDAGGWRWMSRADVGSSSRMAAHFVKWSQTITSRETLSASVARACQIARMAPQGPVYLSVAHEYLEDELEEVIPRIPGPQVYAVPDPAQSQQVADWLRESKKPIIITERIGANPQAVPKLVELAEALSIPVYEAMRQYFANFPKQHPLHAGFDVAKAIREADLVLVVAATNPWNPQRMAPRPDARVIFIDDQALYQQLPFWNYRADLILAADPRLTLAAVVESVKTKRGAETAHLERREQVKAAHEQLFASWREKATKAREKKPIDTHWLCQAINESLPPEAVVVSETVSHMAAISQNVLRLDPGNFFNTNIGGLGCGMGTALGVKLASPDQPVIHLVGDGSFNYGPVVSALGLAQEYRLPVLTVVFNNGAYRAMQTAHLRLYPEGWAQRTRTFYGVDIAPNPDYAQLMKAFDGYGEKVEDPREVAPALGRAWAEIRKGRSALLDVILEPGDPR